MVDQNIAAIVSNQPKFLYAPNSRPGDERFLDTGIKSLPAKEAELYLVSKARDIFEVYGLTVRWLGAQLGGSITDFIVTSSLENHSSFGVDGKQIPSPSWPYFRLIKVGNNLKYAYSPYNANLEYLKRIPEFIEESLTKRAKEVQILDFINTNSEIESLYLNSKVQQKTAYDTEKDFFKWEDVDPRMIGILYEQRGTNYLSLGEKGLYYTNNDIEKFQATAFEVST